MSETVNWLVHDHRKYESLLDECEIASGANDWKEAIRLFNEFVGDLKLHLRMEDEVLFPLFKTEVGDPKGDIADLSDEHDNLARLLNDLAYVIKTKDFDHFEVSLEPLKKALFEHNAHEEEVFRQMGSSSLLEQRDDILARMRALGLR
ncbi:MAG: hemerythrin domain-containing protein [Sulfuriferula sp.]